MKLIHTAYHPAPKSADQGKKQVATDHEALHRDATIHQAVQSSESHLTPLDLETIMSNKGVVKYWYLHRPKTMEIVHKNAVKRDAEKKEAERLAAMTPDERRREEEERIAFDLKVEETRRLKRQATALAEEKAAQELAEQARLAALAESERLAEEYVAARERELALQAEKQAKYEDSLGRDVPIVVTDHGRGRVLFYDRETEVYSVAIEHYGKPEEVLDVYPEEIVLDGERILSPKTLVDTPFGVGEVVGLDPHLGCYAVTNLVVREEGVDETAAPQAFLQIRDIVRHVEERESHDVVVEAGGLPIPDEITMKSARIVNSKIVTQSRHKFVQYHLEIQTTNYGTVYCWKRYSTFRLLCDRLMNEAGYKKKEIPELPKRHITGNMSEKTIRERVEKLNEFLDAAVRAEHLQWGIKVDDQIAVYKRRVKKPRNAAPAPSSSVFGSRRR
ncbi:hypothetical protein DYB32_003828 [Aphanomyces invadans]|uniref:PX domain-containing protein n=1 Tax=Aphanomyces invadans TaxID=157072 RepID=A0A418AZI2_9STRA|nr:hypothetical protein DYB32_003828 [Aphanomyces invadans]